MSPPSDFGDWPMPPADVPRTPSAPPPSFDDLVKRCRKLMKEVVAKKDVPDCECSLYGDGCDCGAAATAGAAVGDDEAADTVVADWCIRCRPYDDGQSTFTRVDVIAEFLLIKKNYYDQNILEVWSLYVARKAGGFLCHCSKDPVPSHFTGNLGHQELYEPLVKEFVSHPEGTLSKYGGNYEPKCPGVVPSGQEWTLCLTHDLTKNFLILLHGWMVRTAMASRFCEY